jgi:hypothetical protein
MKRRNFLSVAIGSMLSLLLPSIYKREEQEELLTVYRITKGKTYICRQPILMEQLKKGDWFCFKDELPTTKDRGKYRLAHCDGFLINPTTGKAGIWATLHDSPDFENHNEVTA